VRKIEVNDDEHQSRNQGRRRGGEAPLEKFSLPLEKCVGHRLKLLDIVKKIWAPLRKVFAPPSDPSWLRAWWAFSFYGVENWLSLRNMCGTKCM